MFLSCFRWLWGYRQFHQLSIRSFIIYLIITKLLIYWPYLFKLKFEGFRKQNKITTKIWKWKPQKNTNMFTHKTTSYFKAIVKGNDLINSKTIDWIWAIYVTPWSPKTIKLTRSEAICCRLFIVAQLTFNSVFIFYFGFACLK